MRGFEIGPLCVYFRKPFQIWWRNKMIVTLRIGLPNG